jgi:predicted lipoprotein with Yx(FWY)xxD motif
MAYANIVRTGVAGIAAAALLAACSSSAKNSNSQPATPGSGGGLATRNVSGVGTVLVDASGKTLYTAEQEANGTIKCTGSCVQFWIPDTDSSTTAPSGVMATISSMKRPDTSQVQLTYNGAPMYTFAQDSAAGDAKGNGFQDAFGSNHFTWHAVVVTPASGASTSSGGGGGGGY